MKLWLPLVILGPIALAWAVTSYLFSSATGAGANYQGHTEGYGEMMLSMSIMFCIAIWIGALFCYLLLRHRGDGSEGPDMDENGG